MDDLTGSSKKNKRTSLSRRPAKNKRICKEGETTELLISDQDVLSELSPEVASNLSRSVVSLSLSHENKVLFACSGIPVQLGGPVSGFLTSASLVKAFNDKRTDHGNLKIEVRHEHNLVTGFLGQYDLDRDIAVVNVKNFPGLSPIVFRSRTSFPPHTNAVALGCGSDGKLITKSGILNFDPSGDFLSRMLSTCKITEVCEGGPLFDFDGGFLGMNLSSCAEGTFCLPSITVLDQWWHCMCLGDIRFPLLLNSSKEVRVRGSSSDEVSNYHKVYRDALNKDELEGLESLGYPEPPKSMLPDGIVLAYTFEEPFGDIYDKGVWSELRGMAATNIQENIVALASFNGKKRFFACTGCFIEWNGCTTILTAASLIRDTFFEYDIVKNLRIEVVLPSKDRVDGILQHYNLHYNIALVNVNGYCPSQPVKIQHRGREICDVVAVGRIFESGELMASRGREVCLVGTHDCGYLEHSNCIITKAGIGGPLLDFDGKFVGMNFYGNRGNPFLSWPEILHVLGYFEKKKTVTEAGYDGYASRKLDDWTIAGDISDKFNSWDVPKPYWCRPDKLRRHVYKVRTNCWANRSTEP
ncbi:hypothetical protein BDA96_03G467900 [Sorghum bicolor]|uniref:Uncharacterized protein n=1 Tax=Sorghum bicolor TaxID=4558 RepID=A0A921RIV8_SORBI|nr:hypothetical protein BDA96_03G467900 [Sorghum bicolor]